MIEITEKLSNKLRNMSIVCACLVVFMHVRPEFRISSAAWYVKQFVELGVSYISVPFFFVASGFLLAGKFLSARKIYEVYTEAIKKRIRSLLIPYFAWMLSWWFMTLIVASAVQYLRYDILHFELPNNFSDWARILGVSPLGLPNLTVLWFVRNLLFLVLVSPVIFKCLRKYGRCFLVAMFVLYVVTYPWPERLFPRNLFDLLFFCGLFSLVGLFWFTFGMALRMGLFHVNLGRNSIVVCMVLGLVMSGFRTVFVLRGASFPVAVFGFLSMCCYLYSIWRMMPDKAWPKWLVSSAFPIYLMHKFVLYFSGIGVGKMGGDSLVSYFLEGILGCVLPIGVTVFLRAYLPKVASISFGGR